MRKPILFVTMLSILAALAAACGDASNGEPVNQPQGEDAGTDAKTEAAVEKDAAVDAKADAASDKDAGVEAAADDAAEDAAPTGFCDDVEEGHVAILFVAPQPRGDGFLAAAAWVHYPPYAARPDVAWTNPFPGCVADYATDQEVLCDFGPAFQGMSIEAVFGLNDGSPTSAITSYFSWNDTDGDHVVGEAYACDGHTVVGTMKNGTYDGLLKASTVNPLNMALVVP